MEKFYLGFCDCFIVNFCLTADYIPDMKVWKDTVCIAIRSLLFAQVLYISGHVDTMLKGHRVTVNTLILIELAIPYGVFSGFWLV